MLVTAKVNFTGLAPIASWFDRVPAVWNTFKAVRDTPPARSVDIDFRMVRGTGGDAMTVNVQQGTARDRSNAGTWFRADSQLAFTIPHEFGHLIGLQDEYQQHAGDYVRSTGHEPPVGVTTAPPGQTPASIAQALQSAMLPVATSTPSLQRRVWGWHRLDSPSESSPRMQHCPCRSCRRRHRCRPHPVCPRSRRCRRTR